LGNYELLEEFKSAARTPDELSLITCYSPQEIVERLGNKDLFTSSDAPENGK
jgi:hypothetical protein